MNRWFLLLISSIGLCAIVSISYGIRARVATRSALKSTATGRPDSNRVLIDGVQTYLSTYYQQQGYFPKSETDLPGLDALFHQYGITRYAPAANKQSYTLCYRSGSQEKCVKSSK